MNDLTVIRFNDTDAVDSREVAMMVEKEHNDLLKNIRTYIKHLGQGDFAQSEFFIESSYINSQNKEMPCYLCTKKGCDMIANKLTGKKGVIFTAKYVTAFEKMKNFIEQSKQINGIPFTELVQSIDIVANSLKVNDTSKIYMYHKLYQCYNLPTDFLPKYEFNNNRELKAATTLLKELNLETSAIKFNQALIEKDYLLKKSRTSSNKTIKYYNSLTDAGLKYGENAINPHNQKETQPLYYSDTFKELYDMLNI